MRDPYAPPAADIVDASRGGWGGWLRVLAVVAMFAPIALALSWLVVPALASWISGLADFASMRIGPTHLSEENSEVLAIDLALTFVAFFTFCALAAKYSNGRPVAAALAVASVGWLVYFVEVGGIQGIALSGYPIWYELAPCHWGAGLAAAYVFRRRRQESA